MVNLKYEHMVVHPVPNRNRVIDCTSLVKTLSCFELFCSEFSKLIYSSIIYF